MNTCTRHRICKTTHCCIGSLGYYSLPFQTNLKCIENCTTTLAILSVQTNTSVQADPDQHAPNGAVGSYSTLVAISSAYFVHKRLVKPLKSLESLEFNF